MTKNLLAVLLAAIFLSFAPEAFARTESTRTVAPDFTLPDPGGSVTLSAYRGKVVLVDFWASWCGPCRQSFPWMSSLYERYASQGFEIVAVNLDKQRDLAERFLEEYPAPFVIAFDPSGRTAEAFHVQAMPTSFVVGRDGRIVDSHAGFLPAKTKTIEDEIKEALSR